ncbi:MAG: GNAT family N-acetyltransferase [Scytolyngbya sp. HA4215-MV1]|jgi:predicted acetyltransferase|nr:GNAT family N-acetyltransferase [Scytolyngbya sp. HA4215-MV1]
MALDLPGITLRLAQTDDLPQIVNLERLAFAPLQSNTEIERDWFPQGLNPPGRRQFLAIEDLTRLGIGVYTQIDLALFIESQEFPTMGIAGVAVAPEGRKQRIARLLLEHALDHARTRQIPLIMLYPFQHGFYRQLGWAWVGRVHQYPVACRSLPLYPERFGIIPYDPEQHQSALQQIYQQSAARHNGWLKRQSSHWQSRLARNHGREIYCYVESGKLLGYVVFQFNFPETPLFQSLGLVVQEWVALTAEAYRGILGFLAALEDQVEVVVWNTYPEDPFPYLLKEQQRHRVAGQHSPLYGLTHRFGEMGGGFMWRLADLTAAFQLRPIQSGSAFTLTFQIDDPILGEQTLTVNFAAGQMQIVKKVAPAILKTSIAHLTELFCGLRRSTELVWTREIEFEGDRSLLQKLDIAWQSTPPFCWDFF